MSLLRPTPSAIPALAEARRRRWLWFFAILAGMIVTVVAFLPVYRWGKAWRARSLAANAEQAISAARWQEAAGHVQAAVQLAPGEPAALRAAARLYTRIGAPQAFGYWKALVGQPSATTDDRREATQFGLAVQRYDLSEEQLAILQKAEPARAENLDLAAQLALQRNDRDASLRLTNQALGIDPGLPTAQLRHGQLLLVSDETGQRTQGIHELQSLGKSTAPTALAALETLATCRDLSPDETLIVAQALSTHPAGKTEHRLTAISLQMRLAPEKRAQLLNDAIRDFGSGGPDALLVLARWVMQQGEPARVLELLPLELSLTRQDFFLLRVDALAAQKEWKEIQRVLTDERLPIETFHRKVFLARAAIELGQPIPAEAHWRKALDEASRNPSLLFYLAQYTEKIRVMDVAEKAWRQLARSPTWALRANAALVPIVEAKGDTRALRDILRKLADLAPHDPAPRHDVAYLDLLLEENIPAARLTAQQLLREHPERLAYRTTVALGHLRADDAAGARRQYDGLEIPWEKASASAQAVHVAVLLANQEIAAARTVAGLISQNALKPEERELLAPLQRTLPRLRVDPGPKP